ncbi:MAG: DUF4397 domain-containing protein, partial [Pseudomonadota bacterium]
MFKRPTAVLALSLAFMAGCDSDPNQPNPFDPPAPPPPQSLVQVLHASPDAPEVTIEGISGTLGPIDYKFGSAAFEVDAGDYTGIEVFGVLPDGMATMDPVFPAADLTFAADTLNTIIALGQDLAITPLVLTQPSTGVPAGSTRVQVVHGAVNAPPVSVFLTAPGADLQAEAPVTTFAFGETSGDPVDVPAGGPYQIRITLPFTPPDAETVVFDSGEITLADGATLIITAVDNTTSADALEATESPVTLIVMDTTGSSEIIDQRTPFAELRVVHASADAPAVDIVVNDDLMAPLVGDLTFPNFAPAPVGFVEVAADSYNISVVDSLTQAFEPIDLDGVALDQGVTYDVIAFDEINTLQGAILTDDYRRIETAAKLRAFHASTVADGASPTGVDIYITDPMVTDLTTVDPAVAAFTFGENTGFVQLDP